MKHSRRLFLEAGLALPAVLGSASEFATAQSPAAASSQDSSFDPWVEIHRENLRHNVAEISRRVSARPILAVIKNNGYGMGVVNIAPTSHKPVSLHIRIDTGIGRVGVPYHQAAPLVRDLAARKSVRIQGTMMTFTEDPDFDKEQLRRFNETCSAFEKEAIPLGKKHAASSFSLFQHPDAF